MFQSHADIQGGDNHCKLMHFPLTFTLFRAMYWTLNITVKKGMVCVIPEHSSLAQVCGPVFGHHRHFTLAESINLHYEATVSVA